MPRKGEKKPRVEGPRGWFGMDAGLKAEIEGYRDVLRGPDGLDISFAETCRLLVIAGLRAKREATP